MSTDDTTKADASTNPPAVPLLVDKTIDIGIGLATGILTTALLLLSGYLINEKVIPWYQSVVYEGIIISGTWHAVLDDPKVITEERRIENEMKITQQGHIVKGVVTKRTTTIATGKVISEAFIVQGRIRDRLFYGYIYPESQARLSALSFLYQVEGSGNLLVGQRVFYHIIESKIRSAEETWEKQTEN